MFLSLGPGRGFQAFDLKRSRWLDAMPQLDLPEGLERWPLAFAATKDFAVALFESASGDPSCQSFIFDFGSNLWRSGPRCRETSSVLFVDAKERFCFVASEGLWTLIDDAWDCAPFVQKKFADGCVYVNEVALYTCPDRATWDPHRRVLTLELAEVQLQINTTKLTWCASCLDDDSVEGQHSRAMSLLRNIAPNDVKFDVLGAFAFSNDPDKQVVTAVSRRGIAVEVSFFPSINSMTTCLFIQKTNLKRLRLHGLWDPIDPDTGHRILPHWTRFCFAE